MIEFNEPWTNGHPKHAAIQDAKGECLLWPSEDGTGVDVEPEIIDRIIACVNFCRNLPTEWLKNNLAVSRDVAQPFMPDQSTHELLVIREAFEDRLATADTSSSPSPGSAGTSGTE